MASAKKYIKSYSRDKKKSLREISIGRFAVTYLVLMGLFFLLLVFKPLKDRIDVNDIYTRGIVLITSKVLAMTGISCTQNGSTINVPGISLDVRFGCNGLEAVMIYAVAVIVQAVRVELSDSI